MFIRRFVDEIDVCLNWMLGPDLGSTVIHEIYENFSMFRFISDDLCVCLEFQTLNNHQSPNQGPENENFELMKLKSVCFDDAFLLQNKHLSTKHTVCSPTIKSSVFNSK